MLLSYPPEQRCTSGFEVVWARSPGHILPGTCDCWCGLQSAAACPLDGDGPVRVSSDAADLGLCGGLSAAQGRGKGGGCPCWNGVVILVFHAADGEGVLL